MRVGVIGAGVMGADHARTLHRWVKGATVSAVADLDADRADTVAAEVGGTGSTDPYAVIADDSVDAVIIASHDSTHADLTLACIAAGKPVLCEKPLAIDTEQCLRVVDAETRSAAKPLVSVGFMRRFDPGYVELKAAVRAGAYGTPLVMHCSSRTVTSGPTGNSETTITNSAIHELDIVPWLLDSPVVEVSWHAGRASSLVPHRHDPQVLLLRTADGVLTTVEIFLNAGYGYDIRHEVVGETGAARLLEPARTVTDHALAHSVRYAEDWVPRFADAYRLELQEWTTAVGSGLVSTLATSTDGMRASAVADALIRSMHSDGRTVTVENPTTSR